MTTNQAQQYLRRWQLVAEAEREELCCTPIEIKIRQISALMQSARGLGWDTSNDEENSIAMKRWQHLREAFNARSS